MEAEEVNIADLDEERIALEDALEGLKSRKLPEGTKERLLECCAALGGDDDVIIQQIENPDDGTIAYHSRRKFVLGDEALDCLRDLRRYLKFDHKSIERAISIHLGEWQILQTQLLPIFLSEDADEKLRGAVLELFVPLTWSIDPHTANKRFQLFILQEYKFAFLDDKVLQALRTELFKSMNIPSNERTSRQNANLRIVLCIFRNLLGIKDIRASAFASHEEYVRAHLQEQLILKLHQESILEAIVTFAASMDERSFSEWNLLVLEIIYVLFRDRNPEELMSDHERKMMGNAVLEDSMREDQERKKRVAAMASRHSRFGGTLSIQFAAGKMHNVHSATSALKSVENALNVGKMNTKWQGGKKKGTIEKDLHVTSRTLDLHAREAIGACAEHFLLEAFNALMMSVKRDFDTERDKVREEDHMRFLRVMTFFLKYFMLCHAENPENFDFDAVIGIADVQGMKYICKRLNLYRTEKKFTEVQVAVDCLKEMLRVVDVMAGTDNEEFKQTSFQTQYNLFYEGANVQALALLLKDTTIQLPSYLEPLIETTHIYFKMLENFSKTKNNFVMRKAKRGGGSKRKEEEPDMVYYEGDTEVKRPKYVEKEMDMLDIERDFAHEGVVLNYCAMLSQYQKCDERFLYYIAVMFHRIFVKIKLEAYFYKLSILQLFQRIMNDRASVKHTRGYRELHNFIKYAVAKLFKRLGENPLLYIQLLYPKLKKDSSRIVLGDLPETAPRPDSRAPPKFGEEDELEVRKSVPYDQKLRVAIVALAEGCHRDFLDWFVKTWAATCETRQEEEFDVEAARQRGENPPDPRDFKLRGVEGQTEEFDTLLTKNNYVRMLLDLLGMKRLEVDDKVLWIIPIEMATNEFSMKKSLLEEFLEGPTLPPKKSLAKLIVKKGEKKERKRKSRSIVVDSDSSSSDNDEDSEGSESQNKRKKKKDKSANGDENRPQKKRRLKKIDNDDEGPKTVLSEKSTESAKKRTPSTAKSTRGRKKSILSDDESSSSSSGGDEDDNETTGGTEQRFRMQLWSSSDEESDTKMNQCAN